MAKSGCGWPVAGNDSSLGTVGSRREVGIIGMCLGNKTPARDRRRAFQSKESSRVVCPSTCLKTGGGDPRFSGFRK